MSNPVSDLDLNLLRYLAVLVQETSVSRTAERLGVTQPAVSAALKRLRHAFGDPILVRSGQSMAPTPRAIDMAERIAPMLAGVRELLERRGPFDASRERRSFTLMGSDYVQFFVLPRLCSRIAAEAPALQIEHRPANPGKVEAWLESGQVDLGIGYLATPPPALRSRLLFGDDQVCLVRRKHPALARGFDAAMYAELPHVAISPGGAGYYGARIDALLKSMGIRRRVALTLPSFLAMPYVVAQTDYVATVPKRFATYFAGLLPLEIVPAPLPLPSFEISLFWHERVHTDLANTWLRQQVIAATREFARD